MLNEDHSVPPAGSPSYIVGIGASAGGLSALELLFDNMPVDTGMAFVVIQHLSPDFKSLMDDLLSRHTAMPIVRVTDGLAVQPNTVYLIPPRAQMTIAAGTLHLTEKAVGPHIELPIDIFFNSLAEDAGERAIGVILSGTGSDGSRGVQAISGRGGFVLVQSPESAQFDGMPRNSIATGTANFILSPERMPRILQEYAISPVAVRSRINHQVEIFEEEGEFAEVFALLRRTYNLDFSKYKSSTVGRRIKRRMEFRKIPSVSDYASIISGDENELDLIYKDLLIGVTEFFRDPQAFAFLEQEIVPALFDGADAGADIRVWSAACATGEEAYSLAILLYECAERAGFLGKITVFATDVHRSSLDVASQGLYERARLGNVSTARLSRFFKKESAELYRVTTDLRKMVVFAPHNLLSDPPFTKLDLLCCRNMLIYLQPVVQEKVISLFHFALKRGGVLFLGSSEGLGAFATEFEVLANQHKMFRKMRDLKLAINLDANRVEGMPRSIPAAIAQPAHGRLVSMDRQILSDYDQLLRRHVPPGMLIGENRTVLHYFGDIGEYLKDPQGRAESNVLNLVEDNLHIALGAALPRAESSNEEVVMRNLRVTRRTGDVLVDMTVTPLRDDKTHTTHFHVYFEQVRQTASAADPDTASPGEDGLFDLGTNYRQHVMNLEMELQSTRESLQTTVEELQTSNEELQATNEELLAANEELQSTNEELHSVNEELYSVNSEFERKNIELKQLNTDHENLLSSIDIGTIFLDRQLRIRKFNPAIASFFRLLPQDIGRPIDHIAYQITGQQQLLDDLRQVLEDGAPVSREQLGRNDQWLLNRAMPFRTENGQIEGVVVTFSDITKLKETERGLKQLNDELEARVERRTVSLRAEVDARKQAEEEVTAHRDHYLHILSNAPALIWRADTAAQCDWFNHTWLQFTGRSIAQEVGNGWTEGVHPEDLQRCVSIWLAAFERREQFEMEFRLRRHDGEYRWVLDIGCPLIGPHGEFSGYIGYCFDVTDRINSEAQLRAMNQELERRVSQRTRDLEEANKNLENVCYSISHELRAPIARLEGFSGVLLESAGEIEDSEVRHCAERIEASSRKLKSVIDSVLLLNRLSRKDLTRQRVDLSALCAAALDELREEYGQHARVEIEPGIVVEGDLDMLTICVRNLLANGIKYSARHSSPEIVFGKLVESGRTVYFVRDNGAGFDMAFADKLFQPFSRLHQESEFHGMGIGLATAHQIVRRHAGKMWAESAPGQGAAFYFTLGKERRKAR